MKKAVNPVFVIILFAVSFSSAMAADLELVFPVRNEAVSLLQPEQATFLKQANSGNGEIPWKQIKKDKADLTSPRPVSFCWKISNKYQNESNAEFAVQISETSSFQVFREQNASPFQNTDVYNLKSGHQYFWRIRYATRNKADQLQNIQFSEIGQFQTKQESPRWLRVPGLSNVRDAGAWKGIGGNRIRQGMIYRGSEMDAHMAITPEGKQILLQDLKIKTDLDLRNAHECGNRPDYYSPLGSQVDWMHVPLSSYAGIFNETSQKQYKQIFDALCEENRYPFYIHCWGGADRTGTLVFMIQAVLGVSDNDLLADYEETSFAVFGVRSRNSKLFHQLCEKLSDYGTSEDSLGTKAQRFILSCGVTEKQIETIRSLLIVSE